MVIPSKTPPKVDDVSGNGHHLISLNVNVRQVYVLGDLWMRRILKYLTVSSSNKTRYLV